MIQMWSCSSAQTPMVEPSSWPFGSGFGQNGSTSKRGAWTPSFCASALFCSRAWPSAEAGEAHGERPRRRRTVS